MEIKKPAIAGTLESSDCQVTVEAGEGKVDFPVIADTLFDLGVLRFTAEFWCLPDRDAERELRAAYAFLSGILQRSAETHA